MAYKCHCLVHMCHNVSQMAPSKRSNVMALQDIVGVLIKKEIREKKLKFDSRNLIVNKVRSSNHAI